MPEATPVGIVNPRLTAERHAFFEHCLVALGDPRRLMSFQPDTVSSAMLQKFAEPDFADLVEAFFIHLLRNRTLFQIFRRRIVRRQHSVEHSLGIIVWRTNTERTLALHRVTADLRSKTEDQRIARLQTIFARHRVWKRRALAERHKSAERRVNPNSHHV